MIGFPLALNQEHTGKVIAPAIITGSCIQLLGTSPDVVVDYVGPFLLPAGDLHGPGSYISYVNTGGSWIGTAELVDFGGNVIATATVSGAGTGFIQVPFDNNVNIPSDTLCYLRFTNTDSGAGVLTWYFEVVRAGALPFIVTPPTLTWTVAHGTSPVITDAVISGTGTLVYALKRGGTTVVSGTKATLEAYVSNRATDIGPSWRVTATITNGAGSATADSNTVAWDRLSALPSIVYLGNGSDVTLVGSDVDALNDQGALGNDLSAPGATNRPLHVATGYNGGSDPYIDGDGTTDYLQRSAADWGASDPVAYTVLVVSQPANNTNIRALVQTNGNRILLRVQSSKKYEILASLASGTGTDRIASTTLVDGSSQLVNARWNGTTLAIGVNGVFEASVARGGSATLQDGQVLRILSQDGSSAFMGDPVAEIVVCAAAATDDQVADYAAWAAWKGWI